MRNSMKYLYGFVCLLALAVAVTFILMVFNMREHYYILLFAVSSLATSTKYFVKTIETIKNENIQP